MPIFTRSSQRDDIVGTDQELWPVGHYRGRGNDQTGTGPHDRSIGPWYDEHIRMPREKARGPRSYRRTDERLGEEVHDRIASLGQVEDVHGVEIAVKDAIVTLTGVVRCLRAKRLAEDEAAAVWGVIDVMNELRIEPDAVP